MDEDGVDYAEIVDLWLDEQLWPQPLFCDRPVRLPLRLRSGQKIALSV
jgi:hypothetical protein